MVGVRVRGDEEITPALRPGEAPDGGEDNALIAGVAGVNENYLARWGDDQLAISLPDVEGEDSKLGLYRLRVCGPTTKSFTAASGEEEQNKENGQ
jgi:hypothetical protein